MSPLVRIADVKVVHVDNGFFKVEAFVQNQGYLPSNVTQQAIINKTAKTVKVSLSITDGQLVMGDNLVDIGHLPGNRAEPKKIEWMVKANDRKAPKVVIKTVSEKGGTDSKELILKR